MKLRRLLTVAVGLTAFAACDDGTDPVAMGTIEVAAYVDVDASNDLSGADDPIQGATITLTPVDGQNTLTATTGAGGIATFDVEVGTYTAGIELPATVTGVTLSSASSPSVTAQEDLTASGEFRYTYVPGSVSGYAFLGSGAYEEGDGIVPGLPVTLSQDGTELAATTTDGDGMYSFSGQLPGEYTVEVDVPPYLTAETESRSVTVNAAEDVTADFGFQAAPTHTVAEARDASDGDMVSVVGIAITGTAGDQAVLSGSSFYLQDESGISIYLADVDTDVELGDQVLVYGERGAFRTEVQLSSEAVLVLGEGTLPEPRVVRVTEINEGMYQGQLVTLDDVYVERNEMEDGSGDVWVEGRYSGEDLLVYVDADAGIDGAMFTEDTFYDLTGVAAAFEIDDVPVIELKPRMPSDVAAPGDVGITIADVRAMAEDAPVTVTATITEDGQLTGNGIYVQDATAGSFVYTGGDALATLDIGDVVTITGTRSQFFDIAQISADMVEQTGDEAVVDASPVTATIVASGAVQGELVSLAQVTVDEIDGRVLTVSDETGQTVVFLDGDSGISAASFDVGSTYSFTGVVSNYRGTEQVYPRFPDDVEGVEEMEPATTIAEARAAEEGTPADVVGVVTVDPEAFGGESYIQDDEAGIAIFRGDDELNEGDQVQVTGTVDSYQGNAQISVAEIVVLGTAELPEPVQVTGADVNAGENPAELVTLDDFEVTEVEVVNDFGTQLVTGTADGETVQLYVDNRTGIADTDWTVGSVYTVTGVMNYREPDEGSEDNAWRIKPRKPADVVAQ